MSNPKKRFLKLFYAAAKNFEDETGVEIHGIRIERIRVDEVDAGRNVTEETVINKYMLELK